MKGISPLIASVLLIAFVMAIGGIVVTFGTTFSRERLDVATTSARCIDSLVVSYLGIEKNVASFKIRNNGENNINELKANLIYDDIDNKIFSLKNYGADYPLEPYKTQFVKMSFIADEDTAGHWNLNDNTLDWSFNDNDGVAQNGLECTTEGKFGNACDFDGDDDHIIIGDHPDFTPQEEDASITVEAWIRLDELSPGSKSIVSKVGVDESSWSLENFDDWILWYVYLDFLGRPVSISSRTLTKF